MIFFITEMSNSNSLPALATFAFASSIGGLILFKRRAEKKNYEKFISPAIEFAVFEGAKTEGKRIVLVTGGNGFLGKYIVNALLEKGLNVIVFDIVVPDAANRNPKVTYVRGNLLNHDHVLQAFTLSWGIVNSVIHTASLIPFLGVPQQAIWDVNVKGCELLLDIASRTGVIAFIYTSSATVMLDKQNRHARKLKESDPAPRNHLDTYTTTKYAAERLVAAANGKYGMTTIILRPAGIFGLGDRNVADIHVRGNDRFLIGTGDAIIDWVPVECVVHAHLLAEEALAVGEESKRALLGGEAYNIGNDEEKTYGWFNGLDNNTDDPTQLSHWQYPPPQKIPLNLIQLLSIINDFVYNTFHIQLLTPYLTPHIIDYTQRDYTFSIEKARKELGYMPLMTVEEAIRKNVEKYRASLMK
jgi:nucleoside-diphosphate-sugar epimerase